ncbi:MAG: hypothetical protein ACOYYU_05080 [Chloroflexota bacterium]
MKLGEIVLEGKNAPERAVIYIIKNGSEILYIGKSYGVENRLAQHLGFADPPSGGYFDEVARAAIPDCWDWEVEFVELPQDVLDSGNLARVNYWITNKEAALIREKHPKYNIHYNVK